VFVQPHHEGLAPLSLTARSLWVLITGPITLYSWLTWL